jgi:hypothetical protein
MNAGHSHGDRIRRETMSVTLNGQTRVTIDVPSNVDDAYRTVA